MILFEMGVNLFNMGYDISLNELKRLTNNKVTMPGNIPPRDVLANGTADDVAKSALDLINSLDDRSRIIMSCGGGMQTDVSTGNIQAFIDTVRKN
jgi:uroporphyrinogen decarboxylase